MSRRTKDKIREQLKDLRHRIELLESAHRPAGNRMAKSPCCSRSTSSDGRETSDQGLVVVGRAARLLYCRSAIDASRDDNGFLGCMYARYSEHINNTVTSHWSTAEAFTNLRAASTDFCLIVGHGNEGIIVTGTGQAVDGTDKYMATGNESSWSPHASPGIPGSRLILFGCKVGGGTAGADFLSRVARVVRKEVGAWTGDVWCSSDNVWGTGDFVVASPGRRLQAVDSPVMYETSRDMTILRLRSAGGYLEVPLGDVRSVNFTPIGSLAAQLSPVNAMRGDAESLLQTIDFANPFTTEDKPGSILVGQLTVTYESEGKQHARAFRVLGYTLIQDTCFPTTYYYASPDLQKELQAAK